ncbi:MAG: hypothetical protein QM664_10140 [Flavihumibacter sp.]
MIFYGWRSTEIAADTTFEKCESCGTQNGVNIHILSRYAHIFWIPVFPFAKTAVSQCAHCKQVLSQKEMPQPLTIAAQNLKAAAKTPWWTFSGLGVIALLITMGMYKSGENQKKNALYIQQPRAGDIYEVKTKDNQYTLYRIDQVLGDSVFFEYNSYYVNKSSALYKLKEKEFSDEIVGYSQEELKTMLSHGEIIDIDR